MTSSPKRRSRLSQERLGKAPSSREGQFLSQPRTRHSSEGVRQPKSGGNVTPDDFAQQLVLAARAPFQLGHDGLRQSQVLQGTVQSLGSPLCLAPIALQTFLGL